MSKDKELKIGGYASGKYSCKCCVCGEIFQGDKRACMCLPCAVTALTTELAKHKWISVKDRLPDEGTGVIACDRNYESIGECFAVCFGRGKFGVPKHIHITHWMPIPDYPESPEKGGE